MWRGKKGNENNNYERGYIMKEVIDKEKAEKIEKETKEFYSSNLSYNSNSSIKKSNDMFSSDALNKRYQDTLEYLNNNNNSTKIEFKSSLNSNRNKFNEDNDKVDPYSNTNTVKLSEKALNYSKYKSLDQNNNSNSINNSILINSIEPIPYTFGNADTNEREGKNYYKSNYDNLEQRDKINKMNSPGQDIFSGSLNKFYDNPLKLNYPFPENNQTQTKKVEQTLNSSLLNKDYNRSTKKNTINNSTINTNINTNTLKSDYYSPSKNDKLNPFPHIHDLDQTIQMNTINMMNNVDNTINPYPLDRKII